MLITKREAVALKLSDNTVWHALLHLEEGAPQISSPDFLLSSDSFSPHNELNAFLERVFGEGQDFACRFPARTIWLQRFVNLGEVSPNECVEIKEFIEKAPFDRLEYVFADESLLQPASILGHSFLRISGVAGERTIDHAISFYTNADTYNLPKLLWDTLVVGKRGAFVLSPYQEEEDKYLKSEKRNLWFYEVNTTQSSRELIRNHLFELRNTALIYFFQKYNCATLLKNILSLTGQMPPKSTWWTTPKNVAGDLLRANLVLKTDVMLTDDWVVAALFDQTSKARIIERVLATGELTQETTDSLDPTEIVLASALNRNMLFRKSLTLATFQSNSNRLEVKSQEIGSPNLAISPRFNPALTQGEGLIGLSLRNQFSESKVQLEIVPASHDLMQVRSANSETEMRLLSPKISLGTGGKFALDQLTFFSMKSYNSWNSITRPLSSQIDLSYGTPLESAIGKRTLSGTIQLGYGKKFGTTSVYGVLGPGIDVGAGKLAFGRLDLGAILALNDSKIHISIKRLVGDVLKSRFDIAQSFLFSPNSHFVVSMNSAAVGRFVSHGVAMSYLRSF